MNTFRERSKKLKPRDAWFGATFEDAPIRAMRDAQFISGEDKIKWLEEMNVLLVNKDSLAEVTASELPKDASTTIIKTDRSHWQTAKLSSFDEVRAHRLSQWQKAGSAARMHAAWELVEDYWINIKKVEPHELRLQRTVTNLRRRGR